MVYTCKHCKNSFVEPVIDTDVNTFLEILSCPYCGKFLKEEDEQNG